MVLHVRAEHCAVDSVAVDQAAVHERTLPNLLVREFTGALLGVCQQIELALAHQVERSVQVLRVREHLGRGCRSVWANSGFVGLRDKDTVYFHNSSRGEHAQPLLELSNHKVGFHLVIENYLLLRSADHQPGHKDTLNPA